MHLISAMKNVAHEHFTTFRLSSCMWLNQLVKKLVSSLTISPITDGRTDNYKNHWHTHVHVHGYTVCIHSQSWFESNHCLFCGRDAYLRNHVCIIGIYSCVNKDYCAHEYALSIFIVWRETPPQNITWHCTFNIMIAFQYTTICCTYVYLQSPVKVI